MQSQLLPQEFSINTRSTKAPYLAWADDDDDKSSIAQDCSSSLELIVLSSQHGIPVRYGSKRKWWLVGSLWQPLVQIMSSAPLWSCGLSYVPQCSSWWPSWPSWSARTRRTSRHSMILTSGTMEQIFGGVKKKKKSGEDGILNPNMEPRSERHSLPLVESRWPLFSHHGPGTVDGAVVLAWRWVHVPGLHHVDRRGDDGGDEAGTERWHEVTRQVVCETGRKNTTSTRRIVWV